MLASPRGGGGSSVLKLGGGLAWTLRVLGTGRTAVSVELCGEGTWICGIGTIFGVGLVEKLAKDTLGAAQFDPPPGPRGRLVIV